MARYDAVPLASSGIILSEILAPYYVYHYQGACEQERYLCKLWQHGIAEVSKK
ncbi:MAG: hypothetical protein J2P36_09855 [Ktedonobacteraceae bacterium]|nr:hypothetical protein [Ktedonobacteraceae bacterium]